VIVNVLICDLKNSKRPPGGPSPGGGGRKFRKSAYFNSFNQVSVLSICVRNRKIEQQSFLNRRKRTITLVKALKVFKRCDLWDLYVEWRRSSTTRTWSSARLTSKISWFFKQLSYCRTYIDYLNNVSIIRNPKIHYLNTRILRSDFEFRKKTIIITVKKMISLTIFLILISQNVETNPGPLSDKPFFKIILYNCNGLGNPIKVKRLLHKLEATVNNNGIVFLQETHIVNSNYVKLVWKNSFISNCVKTNSAGVIILFNNQMKIIEKSEDEEGRLIVAVIENEERKLIVVNAYYPNDHKEGIKFAEKMYLNILEMQTKYPEHLVISAGDYNVCMTENDLLNRKRTKTEQLLAENLVENNKIAKLKDAFREKQPKNGFTWKRGNCYSRLDHIFVSEELIPHVKNAKLDWCLDKSDHAAVIIEIVEENPTIRGPGIVKLNTKTLEDPIVVREIENEVKQMMDQTDESWNPHAKLEFLKVAIRSIVSAKTSKIRREIKEDIRDCEEEINQMENLNIKIITDQSNNDDLRKKQRLEHVNSATLSLNAKLENLRKKFSDTMSFVTKAKWFEYGEKSNKFFLSLNKSRQKQNSINKIIADGIEYTGQAEISKGITKFYSSLYEKKETSKTDEKFYDNCPKLAPNQARDLEKDMTLKELGQALNSCKESSPGPDGIPYMAYKKLWNIAGPIILEAWKYSLTVGKMPPSHLESIITLLPKEGKDKKDVKNWRPITLSNCDAKIITKAISMRTAKALESIIDISQTAYVPGRSVSDNLRSNFFFKNYCRKNNVDAVLISLDAKKAFDSVDHKYIEETLVAYGFGDGFVRMFKTLYRDISARILVNGFTSESLKIERGVKQGDALSCAIFIICIDPLLRNLNNNRKIEQVKINKKNGPSIKFKSAAYADDISIICKNTVESVRQVFMEYERLTIRSGLELNADKTEILNLKNNVQENFSFDYKNDSFEIKSVKSIKICGLHFCSDLEEEYQLNVRNKIDKLSNKIKQWSQRYLTMEGKVLIVKTFGLSQIIYNMQSYGFEISEINTVEKIIFKFLWSTKDNPNGIDRIKRSVMKNDYSKGGMKVTDVECLDKALKLKQFIRASTSKHPISNIQQHLTSEGNCISQEYHKITMEEAICRTSQETMNIIIDYNRNEYKNLPTEKIESDKNLIEEVASINIKTYLKRKKKDFHLCMMGELTRLDIVTLGELTQAMEFENNPRVKTTMNMIISIFPITLQNIAKCYNEDINETIEEVKYIQIENDNRKDITKISVKEMQNTLKTAMKRTEEQDFKGKLGVNNFNNNEVNKFRQKCQNAKLRNIYFRLINNDFFPRTRMLKYKMITDDKCSRCEMSETSRHLLYDCPQSRNIWKLYNTLLTRNNQEIDQVQQYEDLFKACGNPAINIVKIKIIQSLIQIIRPRNWSENNIIDLIKELMNIEKYNAIKNRNTDKFEKKWLIFKTLNLQ